MSSAAGTALTAGAGLPAGGALVAGMNLGTGAELAAGADSEVAAALVAAGALAAGAASPDSAWCRRAAEISVGTLVAAITMCPASQVRPKPVMPWVFSPTQPPPMTSTARDA